MFQSSCLLFQNTCFPKIFECLVLCVPFCKQTSLIRWVFIKITLVQPLVQRIRTVVMMMMTMMMMVMIAFAEWLTMRGVEPHFQSGPLSEILTIADLQQNTSKI